MALVGLVRAHHADPACALPCPDLHLGPVAAWTSHGFTAAAFTSISSSFRARINVRRSTTGAIAATSSALAGKRTQRASTETGGPLGNFGAGCTGVLSLTSGEVRNYP